jgi:MFS transporter, MHS family, proline/betaine transporter
MASISFTSMASGESRFGARQRVVFAATIGNTLEWYDFLIYGFLAVTIAKLFFPTEDELTSLLLSVGTFGAAAVVRPVAGVVLGIYADRVGRKTALTLTIFTMGLGTGLIVLAPTYASIGIWAPVLMVSARLLQGFACGGELGGQRQFSSRTRRTAAEAYTRAGRQQARPRGYCSAPWSRCWFLCQ